VRADSTLLPTLGITPAAGRGFTRVEETPAAPKSAMISYGLWRSRFGADPGAIGGTIRLDGQSVRVVGVLPPQFELPSLETVDVLIPQVLDEPEQRSRRSAIVLSVVGRLEPGIGPAQAAANLQPLFDKSLQAVTASFRKDVKLRVLPLRETQTKDARTASWVLLGAVLAVLLIACANVANLLLARAAVRERETAVRAALGAGRGRLAREALSESTLLALMGGAAGCALAFALLRLFVAIGPEGIPRLQQASVDARVLLFALAVSLGCGMAFGLAPAWRRPRLESIARGRAGAGGRGRFRQFLVSAQIGLSLVLLAGAGLLMRSLWNLENQPLGIRTERLVTASVALGRTTYPRPAERLAFFEALEQRARAIPGVLEAAVADSVPPAAGANGSMLYAAIDVFGRPRFTDGTGGPVEWRSVTPEYFSVFGIPLLAGRRFTEEDRGTTANVVILSEALARRMFPGESAVGRQIRPGRAGEWLTVIGVAADVKNSGLAEATRPEYYVPRKHAGNIGPGATLVARTASPPEAMAKALRAEIGAIDPTLPVKAETMAQRVGKLAEGPRFNALVLGIFAGIGLLLAAIGLYGVIAFLAAQRAQEIGIRMALGATPGAITRMMLRQAGLWTVGGAVAGAGAALVAVRLLERLLFGVTATDPLTLTGATAMLLAVALAAAWVPSRRAAQSDPMDVLRRE
jgi:predicted permease